MKKKLSLLLSLLLLFFVIIQSKVYAAQSYTLYNTVITYSDSYNAAARTNAVSTYAAGSYYLYKTAPNSMINISRTDGTPGSWINPADNKQPQETPPPTSQPAKIYKLTTATIGLRMRTGPSTTYSIIKLLPYNTLVEYLEPAGTWSKISHDGSIGYVSNAYLKDATSPTATEPAPAPVQEKSTTSYITTASVNYRTGPGTSYSILQTLLPGVTVEVYSISGTWAKAGYNGKIGYISTYYLTPKNTSVPKPKIGIAWLETKSSGLIQSAAAVVKAGGDVVYLSRVYNEAGAAIELNKVDGVIFVGGGDIHPKYYGETLISGYRSYDLQGISEARDISDYNLAKAAIALDKPTLAICRGSQILNVAAGGSLIQDIPAQVGTSVIHRDPQLAVTVYHSITINSGSLLAGMLGTGTRTVNSYHHQAVKKLADSLAATATSNDGLIEAIEMPGKEFILGVQFHPESYVNKGDSAHLEIFKKLILAASN